MVTYNLGKRVLCVVMDGIGLRSSRFGNAVALAHKPTFELLERKGLFTTLRAHGTAVGLPSDDDLGNSEVGHNALGAGRVFAQGAKLVQQAIASGSLFDGAVWREIAWTLANNHKTLHFIGLLSDGNVHSHEEHLYAMIRRAKQEGIRHVRIHVLLDGRDVGEKSAEIYAEHLKRVLDEVNGPTFDAKVASGGGRMRVTMDRYGADWDMVKRGWDAHVRGVAPNHFGSLEAAIAAFRKDPQLTDQYFPAFVITEDGKPVGTIEDGDSVILFNFRGDRAMEISRAFTDVGFDRFDRVRVPRVIYAGMMEYDGDMHIPPRYLVSPPVIEHTLSDYLIKYGVRQFACSETQKFGHVTYFWNGNRTGYLAPAIEEYLEIPSDTGIDFDEKPQMKAAEITAATIERMRRGSFDFGRINFANGDMVGHTGKLEPAIVAVETVDHCLGQLVEAAVATGTTLIVLADHGNADEMFDAKEKDYPGWETKSFEAPPRPKTSHTLAPVPCFLFGPAVKGRSLRPLTDASLANIAGTVVDLLGLPPSSEFLPSLLAPVEGTQA